MVLRGNECIVGTLTLAANDDDLRSWSKVALRGAFVEGTLERSIRLNVARALLANNRTVRVGGIVGLFSWKRGKRDNDP